MPEFQIFYAPHNANLAIGADDIQPEVRSTDGRILQQSHIIQFASHFFTPGQTPRISAKKEIDVIRKSMTNASMGNRVVEINSVEEYNNLLAQIAKKRLEGGTGQQIVESQTQQGYVETEKAPRDI